MRNFLRLLPVLTLLSLQSQAQCDAAFSDTLHPNSGLVSFTSHSTTHIQHTWSFGDGSSAFIANPTHTYNQPGQYNVLHVVRDSLHTCVDSVRKIITVNFTPQPAPSSCDARFSDSVYQNRVSFFPLSTSGSIRHTWLFGDGASSTDINPIHIYSQPGQYTVLHAVTDSAHTCVDSVRKIVVVNSTVPPIQCNAGFTDSVNQNKVIFKSLVNASYIKHTWLFGDGSSSTDANPVHIYNQPGQYSVLHAVWDSLHSCVDSVRKIVVVGFTVPPAQCNAGFTDSVYQNQVIFRSLVTASYIKHKWLFGDGGSSTDANPVHNYNQSGQYTVLHTVKDSLHNCVDSVFKIINVSFTPTCQVRWYAVQQAPLSNHYYFYLQYSTNGSGFQSVDWKVNGVHVSSQESLSYTFQPSGRYNVCVSIVALSGCTAQYCDSITVQAYNNCKNLVSFTATPGTAQPRTIQFTASPDQPQIRYSWTFGDGYSATGRTVSHTYSRAGTYNVNLLAIDSISHCYDSVFKSIKIDGAPSETCTVSVTHTTDQQGFVHFTATSNQTIVTQLWTIMRMPDTLHAVTITTPNPVYAFKDSGYYIVCVAIKTNTGCARSVCDSLIAGPGTSRRGTQIPSYPNPLTSSETTVKLNIEMQEAGLIQLKISDLSGAVIYQAQRSGIKGVNNITIPVQQLGKGQYFIDISYGDQQRRSRFNKL